MARNGCPCWRTTVAPSPPADQRIAEWAADRRRQRAPYRAPGLDGRDAVTLRQGRPIGPVTAPRSDHQRGRPTTGQKASGPARSGATHLDLHDGRMIATV